MKNPPEMYRALHDRSNDQHQFFLSLNRLAPDVIKELHRRIFPLYLSIVTTARGRMVYTGSDESIPFNSPDWEYIELHPGLPFCDEQQEVWHAFWDWADEGQISRGMDIAFLKSPDGRKLAAWFLRALYGKPEKKKLPEFARSFELECPEITFGMPLILISWLTFEDWIRIMCVKSKSDKEIWITGLNPSDLKWNTWLRIPVCGSCSVKEWKNAISRQAIPKFIFHPPYFYTFETISWDIFSRQTRAQAKAIIMKELEKQLDNRLDNHYKEAAIKGRLEVVPEKQSTDHYDYLVLYQIMGKSFAEIARICPPKKYKRKKRDSELEKRAASAAVAGGIKDVARRLIGPKFECWLRPGLPGRPAAVK